MNSQSPPSSQSLFLTPTQGYEIIAGNLWKIIIDRIVEAEKINLHTALLGAVL